MARCSSCEADIIWCSTESGKNMPVDAKPDPKGQFVIIKGTVRKAQLEDAALRRETYTSHFATCPDAPQHRRSR